MTLNTAALDHEEPPPVTGAASGLGAEFARQPAARGSNRVLPADSARKP